MSNNDLIIHWFRQDLRLSDNPALVEASKRGMVLPIYILDDENANMDKMGAASRVWLHHSLNSLNASLKGGLRFFKGDAQAILRNLVREIKPSCITWNRCYEPWRIARDAKIKAELQESGVEALSYNGSLLFEPWEIAKDDGTPYRVFTPFFRRGCLSAPPPREPLPCAEIRLASVSPLTAQSLDSLELLPKISWDSSVAKHFEIGEDGAAKRAHQFLSGGLNGYKIDRNFPAKDNVSRMSPHLHYGEISPNQLWYGGKWAEANPENAASSADIDHFLSELGWREFSYSLLYYNQNLRTQNLQVKFDKFPWVDSDENLRAWQRGETGIPIVDAGMRELYQTGYMHNRVRMIVASFLVKNLLIDWRHGERWFWDCLFDADLANNAASWQWVAGSGADAAPYFRIFNPITQGTKFDPTGEYTRKYVPELRDLPNNHLFAPDLAPSLILQGAVITLGKTYPKPIVDLSSSREHALAAFAELKT